MTYDQHIASDPRISAWVSASAGTGKTKVLTDRVLRLLLGGTHPARILCITYTKAASAEMQQRIEGQLGKWAIAGDKDLKESLAALTGQAADEKVIKRARQLFALVLDAPERIRIQTIHGFCQSVLMRFPLEAGIAPHFTLIDEQTSRELLHTARIRLFSESRAQDKDCEKAIESLATLISEPALVHLIESIIADRRKFIPWLNTPSGIESLVLHSYGLLDVKPDISAEMLLQQYFAYTASEEQALRNVCAALAQGGGDSDKKTHQALDAWLGERTDYLAYTHAFVTDTNEPRKRLHTKAAEEHHSGLKDTLLAEQKRVCAFLDAYLALKNAEATKHMLVIAERLLELYRQEKLRHGYMDYDDLILSTVALLSRSGVAAWVLYKLDGGIDHLLVDEAQDTSPEQWEIVSILANEFFAGVGARTVRRTLFVVGDEKQSIYSFQGAAPHAFADMQRILFRHAEAGGMPFKRVRLALSFRSTVPVLKAVDAVFRQPAARDGLVFSEDIISHDVHRKDAAGRVELWPLAESPDLEALEPWHIPQKPSHAPKPETLCAQQIARTIEAWLREKRQLPSQGRAVTPGDIVILVQRRGEFADIMLRALKQRGIPVSGADRLVLTEHIAVMDCMALAEFLLLPQDDLTLATVLKSPFIGLSEEDLFALAYDRGEQTLWQRVRDNPKYVAAADFLSDLLNKTDFLPPYELFAYVLETGEGRKKMAKRLGAEIDDPLNEFLSLALQYTRVHPPSLQGFMHWLRSGATEIKRDMEKGKDEVRIMTVHGAKGLQAPIVFLPDTLRTARHEGGILWNDAEKPAPLWSPAKSSDAAYYRRLKQEHYRQADREYRRLLYVAMTRAEDELYICGWKGSKDIRQDCWYDLIRSAVNTEDGWLTEGDKKILLSPQRIATVSSKPQPMDIKPSPLPAWANVPPADEPTPPKPLAPSRMETDSSGTLSPAGNMRRRERGLLIHRLLQYIPDVMASERDAALQRFLTRYGEAFSPEEQDVIAREVMAVLQHPEFASVFSSNSVAEAPVTGTVYDSQGKPLVISGQIDRLSVEGDDVYVIDYKTNRDVPIDASQVSRAYLRQMEAYRQLLAAIYPGKTIHCALLFTAGPRLISLPHAILESLAA